MPGAVKLPATADKLSRKRDTRGLLTDARSRRTKWQWRRIFPLAKLPPRVRRVRRGIHDRETIFRST